MREYGLRTRKLVDSSTVRSLTCARILFILLNKKVKVNHADMPRLTVHVAAGRELGVIFGDNRRIS